jgi:hypothetical protein
LVAVTNPELIYCAGGNERFAKIAIDAGFTYGAQLPCTVYHDVQFADQNWKTPNRDEYVTALKTHRPKLATVLDLEHETQLPEVLGWAEDVAPYVSEAIIVIPKFFGAIAQLPRKIGGVDVRLGYSVPTSHGGTEVPVWEFIGWPVHLLGGSPHSQIKIAKYLNVASVDGNMAMKMATRLCAFWVNGNARYAINRYWPQLQEADNSHWGKDAPYEAFRRSCVNIQSAWRNQ